MSRTRWAVLGPGAIAQSFAAGLPASAHGVLQAVGSSSPERAAAFARQHGAAASGAYDEILARDDVDAVYVATVHTGHAELALAALRAGKAVLCEKPATPEPAATESLLEAAQAAGVPFVEAYKFRFTPFHAALLDAATNLGDELRLEAAFGFAALTRTGRLFDPALAGGAILDVGGYPASLAVAVAAARGVDPAELRIDEADGKLSRAAVDTKATATLAAPGFRARIDTAIVKNLTRSITLTGARGRIHAADGWGSRGTSASAFDLTLDGSARTVSAAVVNAFAAEADAVSRAIAAGATEAPEMPWAHTRAIARLLAEWRARLG